MIEKLRELVKNTNSRVLGQVLKAKTNTELYEWVMISTDLLPNATVKERVSYLLLGNPNLQCKNGESKKFVSATGKYGFCGNSKNCQCFRDQLSSDRKGADLTYCVAKRKDTWIKKYGVDNVSRSPQVKAKRIATMATRNYTKIQQKMQYNKESAGYEQVVSRLAGIAIPLFSREDYSGCFRKNSYKWKCSKCNNEFMDHVDNGHDPKCSVCYPPNISQAEQEIKDFVSAMGIDIIENDRAILENLELDIVIPSKKIAIEFNGVYWHSSKFKDKSYHVDKFLRCKEKGIHLIQIFEDEWKNKNKNEIVKARLKSYLGESERVYARKCLIEKLSPSDHKKFMIDHHLQGYATASFAYGLRFNGILVAAMSFSKARYSNVGYELVRFCSLGNIVGGASKLFSAFIKEHDPSVITTYANRCWSNGNLYHQLGFVDITTNPENIGFWYVKNDKRYHRSTFNKQRLVKMGYDSSLTAEKIMEDAGYLKIYDCGNYRFRWISNH